MTGINVSPEAKKTVEKTIKKLHKVIEILKKDGWITTDDVAFHHPLATNDQAIRQRLAAIDLLTTRKCRISISGTTPMIEIA